MSLYIQDEAALALMSFLLGAVLMVSYDLLRLFRRPTAHYGQVWRIFFTGSIVRS